MKVAEQLLDKGLGKGNLKIVRAMRIPTARKPGPFKIELESQEAKKEALAETGRLHYYKAQGQKVIIRSSMRFEDRIQKGNWDTMRRTLGLENQLRLSKHGKLLPNNYQQQQQPQMQHQQPQMSQQQQPYAQQQPQMQQPQMPYQQPQMHQQQPHVQQQQSQMWQQPIPQQQTQMLFILVLYKVECHVARTIIPMPRSLPLNQVRKQINSDFSIHQQLPPATRTVCPMAVVTVLLYKQDIT